MGLWSRWIKLSSSIYSHKISTALNVHLWRTAQVFWAQLYHSMEQLWTKIPNPDPNSDISLQLKPQNAWALRQIIWSSVEEEMIGPQRSSWLINKQMKSANYSRNAWVGSAHGIYMRGEDNLKRDTNKAFFFHGEMNNIDEIKFQQTRSPSPFYQRSWSLYQRLCSERCFYQ